MANLFPFAQNPTILLVDDTPDNITLLSALLKDKYKLKIATNGMKALQIAGAAPCPDLILLDVMMPEMDGHETCRRLKADPQTADIPVIFLTSRTRPEDEEFGLSLGAADYIMKPISPPMVLARVATQLQLQRARQLLRDQNSQLAQLVEERTRQLMRIQEAVRMMRDGRSHFDPDVLQAFLHIEGSFREIAQQEGIDSTAVHQSAA
jgi:putative two-component system response regulator